MTTGPALSTSTLTFSPLALPRMSMTEAQALSLIAKHGNNMSLALSSSEESFPGKAIYSAGDVDDEKVTSSDTSVWSLSFSPGLSEALRETCTVCREIEWAGSRLRIHVSNFTITSWVNANLSVMALEELSDPLLAVALETLLTRVFSTLDAESKFGRPQITSSMDFESALPHAWTITACHGQTKQMSFALLEADTLGLLLLANLIKRAPSAPNGIDESALPITVRAELGWTMLSAAELASLQNKDTVFIDHYRVTPGGDIWLVAQGYGLRVRPQADSYCVTQGWTLLMNTISESSPDAFNEPDVFDDDPLDAEASPTFDVDTLPVRLTFSLGERRLTLGELRGLHPGEVFDLERPLISGPVIVRANGRWFGTGDLVDIDGRIGVALRELGEPQT